MKKRKIVSIALAFLLVFSFVPTGTVNTNAAKKTAKKASCGEKLKPAKSCIKGKPKSGGKSKCGKSPVSKKSKPEKKSSSKKSKSGTKPKSGKKSAVGGAFKDTLKKKKRTFKDTLTKKKKKQ